MYYITVTRDIENDVVEKLYYGEAITYAYSAVKSTAWQAAYVRDENNQMVYAVARYENTIREVRP